MSTDTQRELGGLTGYGARQAWTVHNSLLNVDYLVVPTKRSTAKLKFPKNELKRWLPRLYVPAPT
jgi:hypothetical protein